MKINYLFASIIFWFGLIICNLPVQSEVTTNSLAPTEREELQQLRQEKEIRDRVEIEVERSFNRVSNFIIILLLIMTLLLMTTAMGIWLFRRRNINEIENKLQQQLEAEITTHFNAFKQQMKTWESELEFQLKQLQNLALEVQQEKAKILPEISGLNSTYLSEKMSKINNVDKPEIETNINDLEAGIAKEIQAKRIAELGVKSEESIYNDGNRSGGRATSL